MPYIPKKAMVKTKIQSSKCSNPKCGRTVDNPIIVQDLGSEGRTTYQACPYCLTEIVLEKPLITKDDQKEKKKPKGKSWTEQKEEFMKLKPPPQLSEDSDECPYHFGYLSERSKGEDIPEKCMTCKKLVQCMFK